MCGIVGIWAKDGAKVPEEQLWAMVAQLRHRGPDASGVWTAPGLGLGHARLKVLDLSDKANQPFSDARDALVFNGEIFNHLELKKELAPYFPFETRSDTEVLFRALQHWGSKALPRLKGQFALAFYSASKQTLLLARDHAGICPLYTLDSENYLYFASEIKPLLSFAPVRLDPGGVIDYFAYRYNIQNGRTLFQGIKRFHPANFWVIHLDSKHREEGRYWNLRFETRQFSWEEAQAEFNRRFEEEVTAQSLADVEVGMFLSGGIDSRALLRGFARTTPNMQAFTLGFREDDDDYTAVTALKERYGFTSRLLNFPKDFAGHLEAVVRTLEEPFGDLIICANHFLAQEAGRRVKVVLSGEGGDEAFCGYDHQRAFLRLARLAGFGPTRWLTRLALRFLPAGLLAWVQSYPGKFSLAELARLRAVNRELRDPAEAYLELVHLFNSEELRELLAPRFQEAFGAAPDTGPIREIFAREPETWMAVMRAEIEQLTLIVNLLKQDRFCMAFSLEGRVPFVAKSIIELAASLPYRLIQAPVNKQLLQTYADGARKRKKAFSLFATQDYLASLLGLMDLYATEEAVRESGVLAWPAVQRLRADLSQGNILAVKRAMAVVIFLVWWKVFAPGSA